MLRHPGLECIHHIWKGSVGALQQPLQHLELAPSRLLAGASKSLASHVTDKNDVIDEYYGIDDYDVIDDVLHVGIPQPGASTSLAEERAGKLSADLLVPK